MIFQGVTRPDTAGLGVALPGEARPYVTQYGNWDNFSRRGVVRLGDTRTGQAKHGGARPGEARQQRLPVGGITGHFCR